MPLARPRSPSRLRHAARRSAPQGERGTAGAPGINDDRCKRERGVAVASEEFTPGPGGGPSQEAAAVYVGSF